MRKTFCKITCMMLVLTSALTTSCTRMGNKNYSMSKDAFLLDTIINITIYDDDNEKVLNKAIDKIEDYENLLSVHKESSDLYKIKENAGNKATVVSNETMSLIKRSLYFNELTDGLYDISMGPVISLWNQASEDNELPDKQKLKDALKHVDLQKIKMDDKKSSISLDKGMYLDMGSCAKGFIADKIKDYLVSMGVKSATINLGGNVNVIGAKEDGSDFNIGIRDPNGSANSYLGVLNLNDESAVTSGDYERFFVKDGVKYHHILDPKTGYPTQNELTGVCIVSKSSTDADMLSTSVFLLGFDKGLKLVESLDGVEAIFIKKDKSIYVTKNLRNKFKLINQSYRIVE